MNLLDLVPLSPLLSQPLGYQITLLEIVFDTLRKKRTGLKSKGQWQAKEFNQGCSNVTNKKFFKFNRNGIRKVLTGHCLLRRHLTIMGMKE